MPRFQVDIGGSIIVEADNQLDAEDVALDLISGDLTAWADNPDADVDLVATDIKELDD